MTTRMMEAGSGHTLPGTAVTPSVHTSRRHICGWLGFLQRVSLGFLAIFVCIGISRPGYAGALQDSSTDLAALEEEVLDGLRLFPEPAHQVRERHTGIGLDLEAVESDLDDDSVTDPPILTESDFVPRSFSPHRVTGAFVRSQNEWRPDPHRVSLPRGPPSVR